MGSTRQIEHWEQLVEEIMASSKGTLKVPTDDTTQLALKYFL